MKKIKTQWDLSLFYKSSKDPQIKKDVEKAKRTALSFEKKYAKKKDYLKNESKLLKALEDYGRLIISSDGDKPLLFFLYRKELNKRDIEAEANANKLIDELTKYENKILFFSLKLGKIEKQLQNKFLKSKKLSKYHYLLKKIFETSKYDLTESEEKIMNLKSLPSHSLWIDGVEKTLGKQTVEFKGKSISIGEAQNKVKNLNTKERRTLQDNILEKLKSVSSFAESEMNTIIIDKKINDELRGFKHPYSATILGYENNEKSILNLANTVTKHFYISNRFYKLKKNILGLESMQYADRGASIGKTKRKISFKEAYKTLHSILMDIDSEYAHILDRLLENGQIDVYPKSGKSDGAFVSHGINIPTMVLLNHTDDFGSFLALAHEIGHAIHTELSKKQNVFYQSYGISIAEVASTFFEQMVFDVMFEKLSDKGKVIALHDKIQGDVETIFRQIALFNYEVDLHNAIREKGAITAENIGELHNKHMKAYLGQMFKMRELDGYFFIRWSHLRKFFYSYTYAYGQIISRVMNDKFREDKSFGKQIKKFLSSGGSKSPDDIFKEIGIDTTKPDFFKKGLLSIEKDIIKLEKLTKSVKI